MSGEEAREDRLSDREVREDRLSGRLYENNLQHEDTCSVCKKPLNKLNCSGCEKLPQMCTCISEGRDPMARADRLEDRDEGKDNTT